MRKNMHQIFRRLRHWVFTRENIPVITRTSLADSLLLSRLPFNAETWAPQDNRQLIALDHALACADRALVDIPPFQDGEWWRVRFMATRIHHHR